MAEGIDVLANAGSDLLQGVGPASPASQIEQAQSWDMEKICLYWLAISNAWTCVPCNVISGLRGVN